MSWEQRQIQAAYTPAGGARMTFDCDAVALSVELRGSAYEFQNVDGALIQRTGLGSRRYPLQAVFHGFDHDTQADAFFNAVCTATTGLLEHPLYGVVTVTPFGPVSRRNALVEDAAASVVEVEMWAALDTAYPSEQGDTLAAAREAVGAIDTASAEAFEAANPTRLAGFKARYTTTLTAARDTLAPLVAAEDTARRTLDAVYTSINQGVDVLIGDPLTLAFQTIALIRTPAQAARDLAARLSAYGNLAASLFNNAGGLDVASVDLFATAAASSQITAALSAEYKTRGEAVRAAESVLVAVDDLTAWRETHSPVVDAAQAQALQNAASLAAAALLEVSFTLATERVTYLPRPRTPVDLAAELYGARADGLDVLITSNAFTWPELLEIPRGRRVVYYV
jgi:prophage DNA circulation protein